MKNLILIILVFICKLLSSQNFIDYDRDLLKSELLEVFDSTEIKENKDIIEATYFIDSLKIEFKYFLINMSEFDSSQVCNKIEMNFGCHKCFNQNLTEILKAKKWKKLSDNEFVSLKNKGKTVYFGPPKKIEYTIEKLTVKFNTNWNDTKITIYHQKVSKEDFKKYRKIKNYR